ncbi:GGDEF domain-containing protein [Nocardia sp. CDC159]|uniref:GGDEF domain-containing protein n=1 Tax=Nocardia pulmonis TaxID=2951408 RepID=A0A9X2E5R0_9NOCA|nr:MULTISPECIES: GGDEF domain-containing protein [Nocardia]MCM6774141.1 GGDEF domain-containing protein [Nocardia pulmonis]MCM6787028.1 GGDEF domain-containing protein [Nocardia sp. CDC159]
MFRTWWRDRVDYRWLVETMDSFGALGPFKFMLGAGGIVMLLIAVLASVAQGDIGGPVDMVQGVVEAVVAGAWTVRWWFLPWPRERESLVWIAIFDIDTAVNDLLVHDRVIGVLGVVLLMAMGGYVTVFHGPRILALHIGWSVLASVALATLIATGRLPARPPAQNWRQDLALGLDIVLVMVVVVGVILPFVQFCHWLLRVNALSDPLTGLLNRRGLDSYLMSRIDRRMRGSAYVATLDLDRFKSVNDTFGHQFGDEVLVRTARQLRAAADPGTLIARTGGEEFVIVGTLRDEAAAVAERLRRAIETVPDLPITITASVGLAVLDVACPEFRHTEDAYRLLLRYSDSAMYRAKSLGGNTVVIADGSPDLPAPPRPAPAPTAELDVTTPRPH